MTLFNSHSHSLARDLKKIVQTLEDLLESTSESASDAATGMRKNIEASLTEAKATLAGLEKQTVRQVKTAARATDRYVHDNPWQTIGIAAGVGVLLGLLISRREH